MHFTDFHLWVFLTISRNCDVKSLNVRVPLVNVVGAEDINLFAVGG